jgi:hypothetical protein
VSSVQVLKENRSVNEPSPARFDGWSFGFGDVPIHRVLVGFHAMGKQLSVHDDPPQNRNEPTATLFCQRNEGCQKISDSHRGLPRFSTNRRFLTCNITHGDPRLIRVSHTCSPERLAKLAHGRTRGPNPSSAFLLPTSLFPLRPHIAISAVAFLEPGTSPVVI